MRYGKERKDETRQRILDAAATLFRRHGIDGVGVDAIMREAGLTHGGFYGHFPSKEALAEEVCASSLARSAEKWSHVAGEVGGREALRELVGAYLDPARVATKGAGCMLPTLGPELARRPGSREGVTLAIRQMADALAGCRDGEGSGGSALADLSCLV